MLTIHPVIKGKLVEAWTEPARRENPMVNGEHEDTRFSFVVDERDALLGAVTNRYKLVRNADMVAALDIEADRRGIVLEPVRAAYENGRSRYELRAPSMVIRPRGDNSVTNPTLILKNHYGGSGGLVVQSGYFRQICANGAVVGRIAHHSFQRHVGTFDVRVFIGRALDAIESVFEHDRAEADKLAAARIVAGGELLEKLMAETARRYQPGLERAVRENVRDLGDTAWAYLQAAAETSTHVMQRRARFNMAADSWQEQAVRIICAYAEV